MLPHSYTFMSGVACIKISRFIHYKVQEKTLRHWALQDKDPTDPEILFYSNSISILTLAWRTARVWFCGVAQISLIQDPPSHKILTDKKPNIMDLHKYNFSAKSCGMEKERQILRNAQCNYVILATIGFHFISFCAGDGGSGVSGLYLSFIWTSKTPAVVSGCDLVQFYLSHVPSSH